MDVQNITLFVSSGSGNHGCEAIVRSIAQILLSPVSLVSDRPEDESQYGVDSIAQIIPVKLYDKHFLPRLINFLCRRVLKSNHYNYSFQFSRLLDKRNSLLISIGGDVFCGEDTELLEYLNASLSRKNTTVLWGCSIEPEKLKKSNVVECMNNFALIFARESITYQALLNSGVKATTFLCADPAFQLSRIDLPLPVGFDAGNTIGINVSPLVIAREGKGMVLKNFRALIRHIIDTTNFKIALIPHVVWRGVDDRVPLHMLYEEFSDSKRVIEIGDSNCEVLKGYIARCRMFIGARTHSTIAAYSSCVPTLAIGYSVKAKGIAKDLFGTYENYVLPIEEMRYEHNLVKAFEFLSANELSIRKNLENLMPQYAATALVPKSEIAKYYDERTRQ